MSRRPILMARSSRTLLSKSPISFERMLVVVINTLASAGDFVIPVQAATHLILTQVSICGSESTASFVLHNHSPRARLLEKSIIIRQNESASVGTPAHGSAHCFSQYSHFAALQIRPTRSRITKIHTN